jgi:hypothetical protein
MSANRPPGTASIAPDTVKAAIDALAADRRLRAAAFLRDADSQGLIHACEQRRRLRQHAKSGKALWVTAITIHGTDGAGQELAAQLAAHQVPHASTSRVTAELAETEHLAVEISARMLPLADVLRGVATSVLANPPSSEPGRLEEEAIAALETGTFAAPVPAEPDADMLAVLLHDELRDRDYTHVYVGQNSWRLQALLATAAARPQLHAGVRILTRDTRQAARQADTPGRDTQL